MNSCWNIPASWFLFPENMDTRQSGDLIQDSVRDDRPFMRMERLYLIDPLGNLMMSYAAADRAESGIIKDLTRLLKYSRIG